MKKSKFIIVSGTCLLLAIAGGVAYGLSLSEDLLAPRISWDELRTLMLNKDSATNRIEHLTRATFYHSPKNEQQYPLVIVELKNPPSRRVIAMNEMPESERWNESSWILSRAADYGIRFSVKYLERGSFLGSTFVGPVTTITTQEIIRQGQPNPAYAQRVPTIPVPTK